MIAGQPAASGVKAAQHHPNRDEAGVKKDEVMLSITPPAFPSTRTLPIGESRETFLKYGIPLYQAAMEGDWETAEMIFKEAPNWITAPITKRNDTVLHVATAAMHVRFVTKLVDLMHGLNDRLESRTTVGNTAFCIAASSGYVELAKVMVMKNTQLPDIKGSTNLTPLHMAILLGHRDMVNYLLQVTTDDGLLNDDDRVELLTSSIEAHLYDTGRDKGENGKQLEYALKVTERAWNEVIKEDENTISELIGQPWRLLFVAASIGNVDFLTVLILSYPDVIWKVDENNKTIFHVAVEHRHEEIFKLIHEIGAIKDLIATYRDKQQNNMLHLAAKIAPPDRLNCVSGAALQMQREILWFQAVKEVVQPHYAVAKNKVKKVCPKSSGDGDKEKIEIEVRKTPKTIFTEEHEELRLQGEEWMKKTAESCTLVATLITTVIFTAAFTLPGGNDEKKGSPILLKQGAFKVFVISNAVSLFASTTSIQMFLSILVSRYAENDFLKVLPFKLMVGLTSLFVSIATMMVAFTATFFITFQHDSTWIPAPIALLAVIPVLLFAFLQFPLLKDIYSSTYRSWTLFQPSHKRKLSWTSQNPS